MSDDNSNVETPDNLDDFENLFYERETAEVEDKADEIEEEVTDEVEDEESDTDATEADEDEVDEADPESDEDEEDEKPQRRNRKTAKERIQELTAAKHESERRELETLRRLQELEAKQNERPEVKETPKLEAEAPSPDAVDAKGEAVYPLGEFDPAYIRDLTRYTISVEQKAAQKAEETRRSEEASNAARAKAQEAWVEKLATAEEEIPELREKIIGLSNTFNGLDAGYGQYLVDVVQSLPNGPQILAYLSDNQKEAQQIVNSGPTHATIALGRLDALVARQAVKDKVVKVTKAPPAPKQTPRGSGKASMLPDTDDLDAFEKQFFKKK